MSCADGGFVRPGLPRGEDDYVRTVLLTELLADYLPRLPWYLRELQCALEVCSTDLEKVCVTLKTNPAICENFVHIGNMAEPAELLILRKSCQALSKIIRAKVNPADHPAYEAVLLCQLEQELCFRVTLVGLNGYRSIHVVAAQLRKEVMREEVSLKHHHFIGNPPIAYRIVLPEVLVRINSHKTSCAANSVSAPRLLPTTLLNAISNAD